MSRVLFPNTKFGSTAGESGIFIPENRKSPYEAEGVWTDYYWNEGTCLLPVAMQAANGDPLSATITQLSSPYGFKVVSWFLKRAGAKPSIPDQEPDDSNIVLASRKLSFRSPYVGQDMITPIFEASGHYIYLMKKPIKTGDTFHIAISPSYNINAASCTYGPKDFTSKTLATT